MGPHNCGTTTKQARDAVIDPTQTAFVPGRDIADNVLCHLEEIDYLAAVQQPGCVLFLDFEKAYDRLDRGWLFKSMTALGFPHSALRWVQLLLQGTVGQILYNRGFHSRQFAIESGCAQGSPLSPLLYVIAAQPLAAKCRQVQRDQQDFVSITMPDGTLAPVCHQHADDTTLHAASVSSLNLLLTTAVQPFCRASAGQLNISKSRGLVMGSHAAFTGVEPVTGVLFPDTSQDPVRHLGILLSSAGASQQHTDQLFQERLRTITWRIRHWSRYELTILGRCEVAKQILASCLSYHIQFVAPSDQLLQLLHRRILAFVLGKGLPAQQQLTQLKGSPSAAVASLPKSMGGIAQVDVRAHATALQAKIAARLLWPHRQPWKVYMRHAFERCLPTVGVAVLVQHTRHTGAAALHQRHQLYLAAIRQVGLQRHLPHEQMSRQQIQLEPLVGNYSVCQQSTGQPFIAESQLPQQYRQLPTKTIGAVCDALPQGLPVSGALLPDSWVATLQRPTAPDLWQVSADGQWVRRHAAGRFQYYQVMPSAKLTQLQPQDVPAMVPLAAWQGCCVVDIADALHPEAVKRRQLQQQQQQRQHQRQQQQQQEQQQPEQEQQQQHQEPQQDQQPQQPQPQPVLFQQQQPPPHPVAAGAAAVSSRRRRMSARDRRITRALTRENPNWRQEQQEQQRRLQFFPANDPPGIHLSPDTPEDQPSGPDHVPLPAPRHQLPAPGPSAPHLLQAAFPTGATLHSLQPQTAAAPPRPARVPVSARRTSQPRRQQQFAALAAQQQAARGQQLQHRRQGAWERRQLGRQLQSTLYLVGQWSSIRLDPSVWGFGFFMGILQYEVRAATQRLLQCQCAGLPGWVPGMGIIPRLWRTADGLLQPQQGLSALEAGQKRSWQQMMTSASSSSGTRQPFFFFFFFLGGASYMDGSHEPSNPKVGAETPATWQTGARCGHRRGPTALL